MHRATVDHYQFGMPRVDWEDDNIQQDTSNSGDDPPKTPTIEEMQAENAKLQRILKTQNEKVIRLADNLQKEKDLKKQFEEQQKAAMEQQQKQLQAKGEYEPLLEQVRKELEESKAAIAERDSKLTEASEQMKRHRLETAVYLDLKPRINPEWTKAKDPTKEAIKKFFPFDQLVLDDEGEPTNLAEVTKELFATYPTLMASGQTVVNGNGQIIGPGSQKKADIPQGKFPKEVMLIAEKEFLSPEVVQQRLNGDKKDIWTRNWRRYLQKSKRPVFA